MEDLGTLETSLKKIKGNGVLGTFVFGWTRSIPFGLSDLTQFPLRKLLLLFSVQSWECRQKEDMPSRSQRLGMRPKPFPTSF